MSVTLNFKPCDNTGEIYNLLKIGVGNESLDFFLKKKKKHYLRDRQEGICNFLFSGLLSKCLRQPRLGQAASRSQEFHLLCGQ